MLTSCTAVSLLTLPGVYRDTNCAELCPFAIHPMFMLPKFVSITTRFMGFTKIVNYKVISYNYNNTNLEILHSNLGICTDAYHRIEAEHQV